VNDRRRYADVFPVLRWLSLISFMRCFRIFLADSLTGNGYQRKMTVIQAEASCWRSCSGLRRDTSSTLWDQGATSQRCHRGLDDEQSVATGA
jgi:hypothetical protein